MKIKLQKILVFFHTSQKSAVFSFTIQKTFILKLASRFFRMFPNNKNNKKLNYKKYNHWMSIF